ncbi:hypothetical protein Pan181_53150 [Aeoliella mucimassa]|uniref:Uncharacterized protein n=2 Tax=Aeoliella mucimassa TaxID=2527972 RepID=A0A518AWH1_9BACT|nr:hypothetical protein Pan181_53150 [Aeoliella mucimassa]
MVRVTALSLIAAGVCGLTLGALWHWTNRETTPLVWGGISTLLGWSLLRRRNWARVCVAIFSFGYLLVALLVTIHYVIELAKLLLSSQLTQEKLAELHLIPILCALLILYFVHLSVVAVSCRDWFRNNPPICPFVVWNPLHWNFRITTLLYLTLVVAISSAALMRDPYLRVMRTQRWAESIDQNDPIYFPKGFSRLLTIASYSEATQTTPDHGFRQLQYWVVPNQSLTGEPAELGFALFHSSNEGEVRPSPGGAMHSSQYGSDWQFE